MGLPLRNINVSDIYQILSELANNKRYRQRTVPLFMSNPGIGKTHQVYKFAKDTGRNVIPYILSQRNPMELSGMFMPNTKRTHVEYLDFRTLIDMKDGDILFVDEITQGHPSTLSAFLTLLQDRTTISGKKLPDIIIVAAGNYQGQTPMIEPVKERFDVYNVKYSFEDWFNYMSSFLPFKTTTILQKINNDLISKENFEGFNFATPRSITDAIMDIIEDCHTPYYDILLPYLNELIPKKPSDSPLKITESYILESNQQITWLEFVKMLNKEKPLWKD